MKRATFKFIQIRLCKKNFNPHPLWRGRRVLSLYFVVFFCISIHTLCEEGDIDSFNSKGAKKIFQSTPSVKRATIFLVCRDILHSNFNPHPLWRGRRSFSAFGISFSGISIHTLCEEGDCSAIFFDEFLSRISIHTLCEEGDYLRALLR